MTIREALQILKPFKDCMFDQHGCPISDAAIALDVVIKELENKEWIPCSKRLPKYRKMVDVTTRDLRVELAYLDSIKEDGTDDLWIIPLEDAECALWNIVAWKPRPEPWEGEVD